MATLFLTVLAVLPSRRCSGRSRPGAFRIEAEYLDLWASWFERPTDDELREQ